MKDDTAAGIEAAARAAKAAGGDGEIAVGREGRGWYAAATGTPAIGTGASVADAVGALNHALSELIERRRKRREDDGDGDER